MIITNGIKQSGINSKVTKMVIPETKSSKTRQIRNIVVFIVFALFSGWIGIFIDRLLPEQTGEESLGMAVWLVLPLIVVVILRSFAGDGWKDARLKPLFLKNMKWYAISLFIFPVVTGIVLLIGKMLGWIDLSNLNPTVFIPLFFNLLIIQFIKNIFEESVWRGYLTSKLLKFKMNDLSIYLLAGLVWSAWHLPYYLVFLPDQAISTVLPVGRMEFFLVATFTMLAWTVVFTELFRLSFSIWPVVILHAVEDALINPLVIDNYIVIEAGKEVLISPICGLITTLFYLIIGLILRKIRLNQTANIHI